MRVVAAMDSFKGSLDAIGACRAVADGLRAACDEFEVDMMPMSDGGEGFLDVLAEVAGGGRVFGACHDPLCRVMRAPFLRIGADTAAIETAAASGLTLIKPAQRDILSEVTFGTGEQVRSALDAGCKRICMGLGGSATCDGGLGLMRALGVRFMDASGREITMPAQLVSLEKVDISGLDPRLAAVKKEAACDVSAPLCGPSGAACVFGPQKGASPEQVKLLDSALGRLRDRMQAAGLGMDGAGAGAAGGLGGALMALGFELRSGTDMVLELSRARERIAKAELVIVGEGMTDAQTAAGKAPCGVAGLARALGRAAICISGALGDDYSAVYAGGITAAFSAVARPMSLDCAIKGAREYLFSRACDIGRLWRAARSVTKSALR